MGDVSSYTFLITILDVLEEIQELGKLQIMITQTKIIIRLPRLIRLRETNTPMSRI
jgi:hypothetical protein